LDARDGGFERGEVEEDFFAEFLARVCIVAWSFGFGFFTLGRRRRELFGCLAQEGVSVEKAFGYALERSLFDSEEAGGVKGIFGGLGKDAVVGSRHCC
jgi:hypothetical protein